MATKKARIDWKGIIIPKVSELLEGFSYRPTLRQVFYRLVAALLIQNTENTYKGLSRATVEARENGILDPLAFEDRVRKSAGGDDGWDGPEEFIEDMLNDLRWAHMDYSRRLWDNQVVMPVIWLEKDALFTPVAAVGEQYRVRTYAAVGFSSFTAVYEAVQDNRGDKPIKVLQLTDFDPSGEDMVRDLRARVTKYGGDNFEITKIALTRDQVTRLGLPPMMAKTSDPRYKNFAASYGNETVELDALPPDELQRIVTTAIKSYIDIDKWNADVDKIKNEQGEISKRFWDLLNGPLE